MLRMNLLSAWKSTPKYVVHRGYLLPAPPKRPLSLFTAYYAEKVPEVKNMQTALEYWRGMPKYDREAYRKKYAEAMDSYAQHQESYRQKYLLPLKRTPGVFCTFCAVRTAELRSQGVDARPLSETPLLAQEWAKLTPEQKNKYRATAPQQKADELRHLKIPHRSTPKEISKRAMELLGQEHPEETTQQIVDRWRKTADISKRSYKQQVQDIENKELAEFLARHHLTAEELEALIKERKEKQPKQPKSTSG